MNKMANFLRHNPFLIFVGFLLIAYLPVFLPFFHIKNDLMTQNLPTRFVISESIYSGYEAWWNPYINFGIPQYGDMNNGYWNPFLWIIAKVFGYNVWTITLEEMAYVLAGGWGIFLFLREWGCCKPVAIIAGISYMGSGYIVGHLQHFCWITGTAFFPYLLLYFTKLHKSPVLKNLLLGSISIFLFASSTHPGFLIGSLYFVLFSLGLVFICRKTYFREFYYHQFWLISILFLIGGVLLSCVVIVSNLDVLQHISRGTKVSLSETLLNPTTLPSYLSLVFPLAVQKGNIFFTDISMRNVYIGLATIIGILAFRKNTSRKLWWTSIGILLFFVLLSAGSWFKEFAWRFLPLIGFVRLNGEFSYFSILIILIAGSYGLHQYFKNRDYAASLSRFTGILLGTVFLALIVAAVGIFISKNSILWVPNSTGGGFKERIKWIMDNLSFPDLLFIQATIQAITLLFIWKNKNNKNSLLLFSFLNLAINCWLVLPFTGLGMASKENRQDLLNTFPKGIYTQELKPLCQTRFIDSSHVKDLILLGAYSKKIGYPREESYPVELKSTVNFYADTALVSYANRQSFIFLSSDTNLSATTSYDSSQIQIIKSGPGLLIANINNPGFRYLTFLQNDYPYWHTKLNGSDVRHFTSFKTFITMPIKTGKQRVEYRFNPWPIKAALTISLVLFGTSIILLCSRTSRNLALVGLSRN